MPSETQKKFGKLRSIFWPIFSYELKKFLPMGFMMMFILFNYTIMRDTKDTLINNTVGPEAFSFLKLYGTLPFAVIFMLAYSKLGNLVSKDMLFHITFGFFMAFFAIFGLFIYPNATIFHPDPQVINSYVQEFPRLATAYKIWGSWTFAIFYIMSELFGTAGVSLLFWRFANDVVSKKKGETTRFYPLFGLIGNLALIFSGESIKRFSKVPKDLPAGVDPFIPALQKLTFSILISGALTMIIYQFLQSYVLNDPQYAGDAVKAKKKKSKLSVMEGIKYVLNSKHLGFIALLVICYGTALAVTDAVWKSQVKIVYSDKNSYSAFMGTYSQITGIVTIVMMIVGSNFLRRFGWKASALITPAALLVTGIPFFAFIIYKEKLTGFCHTNLGLSPEEIAVWMGFGLTIFVKAAKYSLFDPTKEMAYLPLDEEGRGKGKAAVDVVGGRAGKSSGAAIQQVLMTALAVELSGISEHLAIVIVVTGILWLFSASGLNKSLNELNKKNDENHHNDSSENNLKETTAA